MEPKDIAPVCRYGSLVSPKKTLRPKSTGPCQGGPLKLGARTPPSEIVYLGLGMELRVKVVLQNDHKHHISGYASRFQSSSTFGFRVMDQNVLDGHREGSKSKIFKIFELNHVRCLYRGFLTRWIDSWCLFYSRMIGFCDNGPKPVFLNPRWGQNTMVSKF